GMNLPDEYVEMLNDRLLSSLRLVDILIPVAIALSCLVLLVGVTILIIAKRNTNKNKNG
ncbi:jg11466, partial [Pararge aegeria aegeria]